MHLSYIAQYYREVIQLMYLIPSYSGTQNKMYLQLMPLCLILSISIALTSDKPKLESSRDFFFLLL